MTSEPLFRGFSQMDLPRQSFVGHSGHMAEPIYQYIGEVVPHSGLCEFHTCALFREVSHHGLFEKIQSLPLSPELFGHYPRIRIIGQDRNKD